MQSQSDLKNNGLGEQQSIAIPNEEMKDSNHLRHLIATAGVMLAGMTLYEVIKQTAFPEISIWESHTITIVFSTICATVAAHYILKRQQTLNTAIWLENMKLRQVQEELKTTSERLEDAFSEVNTLGELIPICASCKKIRDDQGYWKQIESLLARDSDLIFSHGLCPKCAEDFRKENEL